MEKYQQKSVNGTEVTVIGKINTNVQITYNCSLNLGMLVFNENPFDIILSHNFLEKFDYIYINYKTSKLYLRTTIRRFCAGCLLKPVYLLQILQPKGKIKHP